MGSWLASLLFLLVSVVGAALTVNALRPSYGSPRRAFVSFFAGWLTAELALHHVAWQALATALFAWAGALAHWPGKLGLAITLVSWAGLATMYWGSRTAGGAIERALRETLGDDYLERLLPEVAERLSTGIDWRPIVRPFPIRHREVERTRNIVYARAAGLNLKLDVYRHRSRPAGCPTLMQIHGGAWVIGTKDEQGLPLMLHLAARGWTCVSVNYRLSPHATFPDHLVDLKRALAWIRAHGAEHGADPSFVVVTGGSAGGHLAALVALTQNDPEYQPGFADADTSVQGCVPFYGVYDFTNRYGLHRSDGLPRLLERKVMKASLAEAREAYEKASPLSRVGPGAPPFLVIHGDRDSLAPVEEARRFCAELGRHAPGRVVYAEIPGAQHAFEIFPSLRTALVIRGVERFLAYLYSEHLRARRAAEAGVEAAEAVAAPGAETAAGAAERAAAESAPRLHRVG
jgi:acetyl esterase/lipase